MKRIRIKQQVIMRKQWGKLLMGVLVMFALLQLVGRFGVPLLQRYVASGAPNPPSQTSPVTQKAEVDEKSK